MPLRRRAQWDRQLTGCLAIWFAAILAIAPMLRPAAPVDVVAARSAVSGIHSGASAPAGTHKPAEALRPAQPSALGILARLPALETSAGLPPVKPPVLRPGTADQPWVAPGTTGPRDDLAGEVFHRSSVGTARSPTGPPA